MDEEYLHQYCIFQNTGVLVVLGALLMLNTTQPSSHYFRKLSTITFMGIYSVVLKHQHSDLLAGKCKPVLLCKKFNVCLQKILQIPCCYLIDKHKKHENAICFPQLNIYHWCPPPLL